MAYFTSIFIPSGPISHHDLFFYSHFIPSGSISHSPGHILQVTLFRPDQFDTRTIFTVTLIYIIFFVKRFFLMRIEELQIYLLLSRLAA